MVDTARTKTQRLGSKVKRRASKACTVCKQRKVRCNVEVTWPCNNCKSDQLDCLIPPSKRSRRHVALPRNSLLECDEITSSQLVEPSTRELSLRSTLDFSRSHLDRPSRHRRKGNKQNQNSVHGCPKGLSFGIVGSVTDEVMDSLEKCYHLGDLPILIESIAADSSSPSSRSNFSATNPIPSLPSYLEPLPASISAQDAAILEMKGALSVPSIKLRNELLESYFLYVHFDFPIIDLSSVLEAIERPQKDCPRISLLLFQAMMFAGSAFVDIKSLRAMGHLTRKAARRVLFQKVRLLYDFDYEQNRISLIQSLLLMSLCYEVPDDSKDGWHWLGIAISLARTIGLDRAEVIGNPSNSQRLRKQLWWACVLRDSLCAMGLKRPSRIIHGKHGYPVLTLDDFNLIMFPLDTIYISISHALTGDIQTQLQLAAIYMERVRLMEIIGTLLSEHYVMRSGQGLRQGSEGEQSATATMVLLPVQAPTDANRFVSFLQELHQWHAALPESAAYNCPAFNTSNKAANSLFVHRAVVQISYFTGLDFLERAESFANMNPAKPLKIEPREVSRSKSRYIAASITRIASDIYQLGLVRFLPMTAVTPITIASMIHLNDFTSTIPTLREEAEQSFEQCMHVIQHLRDGYRAADFAAQVMQYAADQTKLKIAASKATLAKQCASSRGLIPSPLDGATPQRPKERDYLLTENSAHHGTSMKSPASNSPTSNDTSNGAFSALLQPSDVNGAPLDGSIWISDPFDHNDIDWLFDIQESANILPNWGESEEFDFSDEMHGF